MKMKGKARVPNLTHEQVRAALDYNPATGVFVWKISPAKNLKAGKNSSFFMEPMACAASCRHATAVVIALRPQMTTNRKIIAMKRC